MGCVSATWSHFSTRSVASRDICTHHQEAQLLRLEDVAGTEDLTLGPCPHRVSSVDVGVPHSHTLPDT